MTEDKNCIFCSKYLHYWPNYSPNTSDDYGNVAWIITKRNRKHKRYFHISCFKDYVKNCRK